MTNQHAPAQFFRGDDDHSDDNSLNIDTAVAIQTIKPALPQAAPIAPSTGFTSRYDSDIDYDDNSVTLSEVDAVENYDDSFLNSSMLGSGLMESWATMEGDNDIHTQAALDASNRVSNSSDVCSAVSVMQGPRFVPPISTEDEETKAVAIRPSSTLYLQNLPMDTVHRLSMFLTATDLCALSMTTKKMGERCEEVWRRVRMHVGRCLGEVMLTWAMGEHADARELASLYLRNGVAIYPAPHGHAMHTIDWRMGLEMKALQAKDTDDENSDANNNNRNESEENNESAVDPFYASRYLNDEEEEPLSHHPPYTYVEEKSVFWKAKKGIPIQDPVAASPSTTIRHSLRPSTARGRRRSTLDGVPLGAAAAIRRALRDNQEEGVAFPTLRRSSFSNSSPTGYTTTPVGNIKATPVKSTAENKGPKMTLRVHRHLVDQHSLHLPSLHGDVMVGPINLHADFFHPNENFKSHHVRKSLFDTVMDETIQSEAFPWDIEDEAVDWDLAGDLGLMHSSQTRPSARTNNYSMVDALLGPRNSSSAIANSPASDVALEPYSFSSPNLVDGKQDVLAKVKVHVAFHQRNLEACFVSVRDFNNALLDWWDEILPMSTGIHFFNTQSPVPRKTHLQSFLTTPCPKAIGVVQCEIERVRVSSQNKLFPTYEYRLFIRDVKNDNPDREPGLPPRNDSVLLVAKNKLRERGVKSSVVPPNESKKGVTNYYLCLPQQRDVDSHYRSVNKRKTDTNKAESLKIFKQNGKGGAGRVRERGCENTTSELVGSKSESDCVVPGRSPAIGRVQGNFTGTEFQIFKQTSQMKEGVSSSLSSDDSSDPSSSAADRRRTSVDSLSKHGKGLTRLARRASLTMQQRPIIRGFRRQTMDAEVRSVSEEQKRKAFRRLSFTKSNRTKRSAIANSKMDMMCPDVSISEEEEIGAVMYTANLLGNRPRIMDVCIPKLNDNGSPIRVWRRSTDSGIEDGESGNSNQMLSEFKVMQQARDSREEVGTEVHESSASDNSLLILQNRPPWWNAEINAFVLNFGGRVSVASVKNFQLVERTNQDYVMLQFGRIHGRHHFTMDLQYPLTPMQAFAIAISSLQSKFSFG